MMDTSEVITITSGDSDSDSAPVEITRREILTPIITRVIDALGGFEGTPPIYRLGDSVLPCLSDLKKLWRKDDTDDDRTCAHIFWESRVLPNDLVPILLVLCKGKATGAEDKRSIAVADLCCAMTWPIDVAEELKEIDDDYDTKGLDYTQLLHSHLIYKAALLRPGVILSFFAILLLPLSKPPKSRTARDGQIISLILHLIRNLAFIRDLPRDVRGSADQAELGGLQGRLVRQLEETHFLELMLVVAANKDADSLFNSLNTLVLEIFYLLLRGVRPAGLYADPAKVRRCFSGSESTFLCILF
jgi:replication fork protection complex subunit Tof1/Swi1